MKKFMASTFTNLVLRVILAFILAGWFDSTGIWLSWTFGWAVVTVMSVTFYLRVKKHYGS